MAHLSEPHNKRSTFRMLFKQIGALLILLGYLLGLPLVVSLLYGEIYSATGFLGSALIALGLGYGLNKGFDSAAEPLSRHALVIAALGWLSISLVGALPFFIIAHITPPEVMQTFVPAGADYSSSILFFKNPLHAFFESMSGFAAVGLTLSVHEPSLSKGLLFYRSLTQWVGGLGFIVLGLAVLELSSGKGAHLLYGSESSAEKLRPTIIGTVRSMLTIYTGLTLFCTLYLIIGSALILPDYSILKNIFDSVNHAMTGMSTAGFSTLDKSIGSYNSRKMEILYLLPMIMGALSFMFYFSIFYERDWKQLWQNIQTRAIIIGCVGGSLVLSLLLWHSNTLAAPFYEGIFQYVSALTTTGWGTSDVTVWDDTSTIFMITTAFFVGGAAGSTAGGLKINRLLFILKGLQWHVRKHFVSGNSILITKFGKDRLLPEEMNEKLASAATFAFIYLLLILIGSMITNHLMLEKYTLSDALFESASALANIGLSSGITHPSMSPVLEVTYIIQMWAGRLEIIPLLVLLRIIFWGTNPSVN